PTGVDAGRSIATSIVPAGPAITINSAGATTSAPHARRQAQPLDHHTVAQVRAHDLVDVGAVHERVPDRLRVHHGDRAAGTTVQAPRAIDAHTAGPQQALGLGLRLAARKAVFGLVVGTTGLTALALVQTEEDVSLVVRR